MAHFLEILTLGLGWDAGILFLKAPWYGLLLRQDWKIQIGSMLTNPKSRHIPDKLGCFYEKSTGYFKYILVRNSKARGSPALGDVPLRPPPLLKVIEPNGTLDIYLTSRNLSFLIRHMGITRGATSQDCVRIKQSVVHEAPSSGPDTKCIFVTYLWRVLVGVTLRSWETCPFVG